jgi:hypothetical protein
MRRKVQRQPGLVVEPGDDLRNEPRDLDTTVARPRAPPSGTAE